MHHNQQQVHGSFSGLLLLRILKEPLYVREVTVEGFLCLLRAAPTAETMSSTSSRWYAVSLVLCRPFAILCSEFLADVSKKTMLWNLAKLRASSWLTWRSALLASRRSDLFPIRNLKRDVTSEQNPVSVMRNPSRWVVTWVFRDPKSSGDTPPPRLSAL